jgi:tRNA nucleotidyltransferase (CCA-adding enzyme)
MRRLKFDNKTTEEVVNLVKYHDSDIQPHSKAIKRWLNKIGYDLFGKLISVRLADIGAQSEINQESRRNKYFNVAKLATTIVKEQQCFNIKDLAVNGRDIMSLYVPEGPIVGHVLKHLLDKVISEEIANEYEALMEEAKYYVSEGAHYQFCLK